MQALLLLTGITLIFALIVIAFLSIIVYILLRNQQTVKQEVHCAYCQLHKAAGDTYCGFCGNSLVAIQPYQITYPAHPVGTYSTTDVTLPSKYAVQQDYSTHCDEAAYTRFYSA